MEQSSSRVLDSGRGLLVLRVGVLLALAVAAGLYVHLSLGWKLMVDSPIMHYVNFLMEHGLRPYQQITDNNMPGAYVTEAWAMRLFGRGDVAWRVYDFAVLAMMTAGMGWITRRGDWLGGVFAGVLFSLKHAAEGPWYAGEREELLTALLVVGSALLFESERRRRPVLVLGFGFCVGMASSIKPTAAPFALLALGLLAVQLRREGREPWRSVLWGAAGVLAAGLLTLGFLLRYGALRSFWFVLHVITPAYVSLNHPGWKTLIEHALPKSLLPLLALGALALMLLRRWDWEKTVLLCGAAVGLLSYLLQQKGFFHHRYVLVAFLLLLSGMAFGEAIHRRGWVRVAGVAGLLVPLCSEVPMFLIEAKRMPTQSVLEASLESDLRALGPDRLQGEVQCFDLVLGCLNALYHLKLVENTGFTGDLLLFQTQTTVATRYYQTMFERSQRAHPADVYVVTNEFFGGKNTFAKVNNWPEFASYLQRNYTLTVTRRFPMMDQTDGKPLPLDQALAYRIYVRNGSALLPTALADGQRGPSVIE